MSESYQPLFPITAEIPLDGEGWYEAGSQAVCVVNFTQPLKRRLFDLNSRLAAHETKSPLEPIPAEVVQEGYEIAALIIRSVTINGTTIEVKSADDIRRLDEEVDGRLVDFLIWEAKERGDQGVIGKRATFRQYRRAELANRAQGKDARPGGGALADADETNQ